MIKGKSNLKEIIPYLFIIFLLIILTYFCLNILFKFQPVKINDMNFFTNYMNSNNGKVLAYIDWQNISPIKDIDFITIQLSAVDKYGKNIISYDLKNKIRIRITGGANKVKPFHSNERKLYEIAEMPDVDTINVMIERVIFSDGTEWKPLKPKTFSKKLFNKKRNGMCTVQVTEAQFYRKYRDQINFDVKWCAYSDIRIEGLIFKIIAYDSNGELLRTSEGDDAEYITYSNYNNNDAIVPLVTDDLYSDSIAHFLLEPELLAKAEQFDINICRIIDDTGAIWENNNGAILHAVLDGRKAYASTPNSFVDKSVTEIAEMSNKILSEHGIVHCDPIISVVKNKYAVIQFDNIDIRIELNENDELSLESASFAWYVDGEEENQKEMEIFYGLNAMIFAMFVKDVPYNEAVKAIGDVKTQGAPASFICKDMEYTIGQSYWSITKDKKYILHISSFGNNLTYFPPAFFCGCKEI